MRTRTIEKLLYKIAAFLVLIGAIIRIMHLSENNLGLYLILAGHVAGVAAIFMYMKYVNDMEQQKHVSKESTQQLSNK
ncbi:hypothetical protein ACSX1A_14090 [Pontibacter sp. MBLB2868]|uniref:hypothetical protein n=1 Tax=Pontibacter sp. MBLB2868 TaxID=3451555 RepID=UPI003F74CAFE